MDKTHSEGVTKYYQWPNSEKNRVYYRLEPGKYFTSVLNGHHMLQDLYMKAILATYDLIQEKAKVFGFCF